MKPVGPETLRPPDDLEERVVARLREAGLLNRTITKKEISMKAIHARWGLAAAVLAAAGVWAGTQVPSLREAAPAGEAAAQDTRPAFALLLYEDEKYQAPAEGEHEARVAEYSAWARKLAASGHLVDGAEILDRGVLLHRDRPRAETVPAGPEGILDGYFVIRAESLAQAERIAAECPHLAYGGSVSVRPTGA